MLTDRHVHPTLPAADRARARAFYDGTLGFTPDLVSPEGVQYPAPPGTCFRTTAP